MGSEMCIRDRLIAALGTPIAGSRLAHSAPVAVVAVVVTHTCSFVVSVSSVCV